jgi:diadenosine tetraphosphate (Ap4A) HIT family hydrolase
MCLFCEKYARKEGIIFENKTVYVINDGYPVSKGHCLVITKRHVLDYFQANKFELEDINEALTYMKKRIDKNHNPDGYNIGVNCGKLAGQSIMHLHVHLIPRYEFDCDNPKGGVRGVIPGKQSY